MKQRTELKISDNIPEDAIAFKDAFLAIKAIKGSNGLHVEFTKPENGVSKIIVQIPIEFVNEKSYKLQRNDVIVDTGTSIVGKQPDNSEATITFRKNRSSTLDISIPIQATKIDHVL